MADEIKSPEKGIIINPENEEIEIDGWKIVIKSKTFWKYFTIGAIIGGIIIGIWSQFGG